MSQNSRAGENLEQFRCINRSCAINDFWKTLITGMKVV